MSKLNIMITDTQKRHLILRKIKQISSDKLQEIDDFVSSLEKDTKKSKQNLSFAGSWENIDEDLFSELTTNLIVNRQKNKRRFEK